MRSRLAAEAASSRACPAAVSSTWMTTGSICFASASPQRAGGASEEAAAAAVAAACPAQAARASACGADLKPPRRLRAAAGRNQVQEGARGRRPAEGHGHARPAPQHAFAGQHGAEAVLHVRQEAGAAVALTGSQPDARRAAGASAAGSRAVRLQRRAPRALLFAAVAVVLLLACLACLAGLAGLACLAGLAGRGPWLQLAYIGGHRCLDASVVVAVVVEEELRRHAAHGEGEGGGGGGAGRRRPGEAASRVTRASG